MRIRIGLSRIIGVAIMTVCSYHYFGWWGLFTYIGIVLWISDVALTINRQY